VRCDKDRFDFEISVVVRWSLSIVCSFGATVRPLYDHVVSILLLRSTLLNSIRQQRSIHSLQHSNDRSIDSFFSHNHYAINVVSDYFVVNRTKTREN
jgi:hypothetical protein